jgi:hypothetical protein
MSTPPFVARVVRGAGLRDSELEIEYDGIAPPTPLFDDLRTIGWVPPVPTPPPATAIDWSRPDPVTGARYSLRSYPAAGRAVPGPDAQDLATLERVVARHRPPEADVPSAPAPAAGVTPATAPGAPPTEPDAALSREREVQIGATVEEARATDVRDALTRRGLVVRSTRMSLTAPGGYRGSTSGTQEIAVRIQLRAPISQIDEVVAILGPDATDVVVRR